MKKIIAALLVSLLLASPCFASSKKNEISKSELLSLVQEYKTAPGFEVVKVGSLGLALIKKAIKLADDDPEAREVAKAIKNIKRVAIVDFDDCSEKVKNSFSSKLERVLKSDDVLVEVKGDGEQMKIFGVVDDKNGKVSDFVLYSPENCALICLFGSVSVDSIAKLVDM